MPAITTPGIMAAAAAAAMTMATSTTMTIPGARPEHALAARNISAPSSAHPAALSHDSSGLQTVATVWALTAVSAVFLALRLYSKKRSTRALQLDDHILVASWLCNIVYSVAATLAVVDFGFGHHPWDVAAADFDCILLYGNVIMTMSLIAAAWSKTSFSISVLRISLGWQRKTIYAAIVSLNLVSAFAAISVWTVCDPIDKNWMPWVPGTCSRLELSQRLAMFTSIYSGVIDLALVWVAWKVILGLKIDIGDKTGAAIGMSMGIFAAFSAFVKASKLQLLTDPDFTFSGSDLVIWGMAESSTTIMAACIPVIRVLVYEWFPRIGRISAATHMDTSPARLGGLALPGLLSAGIGASHTPPNTRVSGGGRGDWPDSGEYPDAKAPAPVPAPTPDEGEQDGRRWGEAETDAGRHERKGDMNDDGDGENDMVRRGDEEEKQRQRQQQDGYSAGDDDAADEEAEIASRGMGRSRHPDEAIMLVPLRASMSAADDHGGGGGGGSGGGDTLFPVGGLAELSRRGSGMTYASGETGATSGEPARPQSSV